MIRNTQTPSAPHWVTNLSLLLWFSSLLFTMVEGTTTPILISNSVAATVCHQKNFFETTGNFQEPVKTKPRNRLQPVCGWHGFDNCATNRNLDVECKYNGFEPCKRIIGGNEVKPKYKYPSIVSLAIYSFKPSWAICGGTILSPTWILTAAHCTLDMSSLYATAGEHSLKKKEGFEQEAQWRNKCVPRLKHFIHPMYKKPTKHGHPNDISLVEVKPAFKFNDKVQPVTLPPSSNYLAEGMGTFVGWGIYTNQHLHRWSDVPMEVSVPIITDKECKKLHSSIVKTHICAYKWAYGSCSGDSGGPMFGKGEDGKTDIQVGIVSWGLAKCVAASRSISTEVSHYIDWIANMTTEL